MLLRLHVGAWFVALLLAAAPATAQIIQNAVTGSASTAGGSATTIIAAQGAGIRLAVTGVQCSNTSATATYVTLTDSASSVFMVPAGQMGGIESGSGVPLFVAANTALQFTAAASVTTMYCNAQALKLGAGQ